MKELFAVFGRGMRLNVEIVHKCGTAFPFLQDESLKMGNANYRR